jgi:5-hydroxytryptamine receptor 5
MPVCHNVYKCAFKDKVKVYSFVYILSAVTDLLVGLIVAPLNTEFKYLNYEWIHETYVCFLWVFSDTVACTASIWTLAAIAADRMMVIQNFLQRC